MANEQLPKDTSPATVDLAINDPSYEFFYFTLLLFTIYGQNTPGFSPDKFSDLFPAEEYIASLQELKQKFTEPKSKIITLTIMNCATLLSNVNTLCKILSCPDKDTFKATIKSTLVNVGDNWDVTYQNEAKIIVKGFKNTFRDMPNSKLFMDRVTGEKATSNGNDDRN